MDGRPPGPAMCASSSPALLPYGLRVPTPYSPFSPGMGSLSSLDFQRSALCDYGVRLQYGVRGLGLPAYPLPLHDPYASYLHRHDLRARYLAEEPKPAHSYIGLIAMAILSSKDNKLVLSDIYQWILDNYPYFRSRGPGWRNSIRHNLSLNDCFVKAGRSANGKGHYWGIHPANIEDFKRGDFRRRRAQRKVRKHMGLAVPDDEDSPSPSPTPTPLPPPGLDSGGEGRDPGDHGDRPEGAGEGGMVRNGLTMAPTLSEMSLIPQKPARKRLFDMESLLAPEPPLPPSLPTPRRSPPPSPTPRSEESDAEVDIVSEGDGAPNLERPEAGEGEATHPNPPSLGTPSPCPSPLSPASDDVGQESGVSRAPQWALSTSGLHPSTPTRPSAFQATRAAPWDTYPTYIYPLLSSSYPMVVPGSTRWRQALYGSLEPARSQSETADST